MRSTIALAVGLTAATLAVPAVAQVGGGNDLPSSATKSTYWGSMRTVGRTSPSASGAGWSQAVILARREGLMRVSQTEERMDVRGKLAQR